MHCGDKFTIVTCSTKSDQERNTNLIKENSMKKKEFSKSKNTEKSFTEFSHMNKIDKILKKVKLQSDITQKMEIIKSGVEDSTHNISQEDVGNVLLSLLGRVAEFQVENLNPFHNDNSDSCDVHTYMNNKYRTGPDRFILGPKNPISQLGLTIPYGVECTPVTFGKLLLLIEKYSSSFCDDLTISVGLQAEEKEKAVKEKSGKDSRDGKDGKKRTWDEKTLTPGTVRGQNNRTISDTLSTTSATETHARGMRRAASLLQHEANLNKDKDKDRNETSKNSSFLPKYFSTPSTPPSHTITLSAIAQRDYSKNKIAQKNNLQGGFNDEKKILAKELFLSYGPLMDTLKILRYNLSILARQVLIAEIESCNEKVNEIRKKNSLDLSLIHGNESQNKNSILGQFNDHIDTSKTSNTETELMTGKRS